MISNLVTADYYGIIKYWNTIALLVISNPSTKKIEKTLLIFDINDTLCDTKVVGDNCFIETFEKIHQCSLQNIEWENFTNVTDTGLYEDLVNQYK
jgi:hypothetical protein